MTAIERTSSISLTRSVTSPDTNSDISAEFLNLKPGEGFVVSTSNPASLEVNGVKFEFTFNNRIGQMLEITNNSNNQLKILEYTPGSFGRSGVASVMHPSNGFLSIQRSHSISIDFFTPDNNFIEQIVIKNIKFNEFEIGKSTEPVHALSGFPII